MYWECTTKDGRELRKINGDVLPEPEDISSVFLRENPAKHSLPFDSEAGFLKFTNLDNNKVGGIIKAGKMPDIHLTYDFNVDGWRLDPDGAKFIRDNLITDQVLYLSMGVSSGQDMLICDIPMDICLTNSSGSQENLFSGEVYNRKVDFYNEAYSDLMSHKGQAKHETGIDFTRLDLSFDFDRHGAHYETSMFLKFYYSTRSFEYSILLTCDRELQTNLRITTPNEIIPARLQAPAGVPAGYHSMLYRYAG